MGPGNPFGVAGSDEWVDRGHRGHRVFGWLSNHPKQPSNHPGWESDYPPHSPYGRGVPPPDGPP